MGLRSTIYLDSVTLGFYRWTRQSDGASKEQIPATLSDIRLQLGPQAVDVIVPARDVKLTEVSLPRKNRQRARQAIAFMVEDQLAVDIEQCHIVGESGDSEEMLVAVVAHQRMRYWVKLFSESGLKINALYPANTCLPSVNTNEWLAVVVDSETVVSTAAEHAFAIDHENFEQLVVPRVGSNTEDGSAEVVMQLLDWRQNRPDVLPVFEPVERFHWQPSVGWPWQIDSCAINLLQGPYQPAESMRRLLLAWRPAAVIFFLVAMVVTLDLWRGNVQLHARVNGYNAQIETTYRKAFPDAKRIVNARAQTEHRLRELRSNTQGQGGGLLSVLAKVAPVIAADKGIQLKRLNYRAGDLNMEIQARDLQVLDRHKEKLSASVATKVEIQSAAAGEGGVLSRLRISGTSP